MCIVGVSKERNPESSPPSLCMPKGYGACRRRSDAPSDLRRLDGRLGRVSRRFLKLSAAGAALTVNGLRPLPGSNPLSVPSFFGGWLTSEGGPHNRAVPLAGTAGRLRKARPAGRPLDRDDKVALALNALSVAGLVVM